MSGEPQPFSYEVGSEQQGTTILRLYGELDMAAAPALGEVLHEVQHGGARMSSSTSEGCAFLDSMGLSALVEAHAAGQDGHRTVSFIAGGRTVHKVFQVTKMDERVSWFDPGTLDPV